MADRDSKTCCPDHHPEPHSHHDHPDPNLRKTARTRLLMTLGVGLTLFLGEALGSWFSGSLALLADAFHVLSDVGALSVTLLAARLAERPQSPRRSYGYYRLEVLSALFNGLLLLGMALFIFIEAYKRFQKPHEVQAGLMLWVAIAGFLANLLMLLVLKPSHDHNINVRGAYVHILGDTFSSVAVIVGGAIIAYTGLTWPDSIASVIVSSVLAFMAFRLIWDSVHVLLEGTPQHMDPIEIERVLCENFPQIVNIHDFHIWEITSHLFAMTAHVEARIETLQDSHDLVDEMNDLIQSRYGIGHTTFQVEPVRGTQ